MITRILRELPALADLRGLLRANKQQLANSYETAQDKVHQLFGELRNLLEAHDRERFSLEKDLRSARTQIRLLSEEIKEKDRIEAELLRKDEFGLYKPLVFKHELLPNFLRDVIRDRRDVEERRSEMAALWIMDISKLKQTNDHFGHWAGDILIETLIELINEKVRMEDGVVAARIGAGDEFAVLQKRVVKYANAHFSAARIKQEYRRVGWERLAEECHKRGYPTPLMEIMRSEVAIGVVVLRLSSLHEDSIADHEYAAQAWLDCTDQLMYKNKNENGSHVYSRGVIFEGGNLVEVPPDISLNLEVRMES